MNDAAGGRTQVAGLVAAATLAFVLLFLTRPLHDIPVAALGAVLCLASVSLIDLRTPRTLWRLDRVECFLSVLVTLGVVAVGAIDAILFAVALAVLRYVRFVSRPAFEILGRVEGQPGFHSVERHAGAATIPCLLLVRFNGPVVFFNVPHFKRELLAAVEAQGPGPRRRGDSRRRGWIGVPRTDNHRVSQSGRPRPGYGLRPLGRVPSFAHYSLQERP